MTTHDAEQLQTIARRLDALASENESWIDAHLSAFRSSLADLASEWQTRIAATAGKADASQLQNLTYIQGEIRKQLAELGYAELATRFVNQFGVTEENAKGMLQAVRVPAGRLSVFDQNALRTLQQTNLDWLQHLGTSAVRAVTTGLVQSVVGGSSRKDMIANLTATVDSNLVRHAGTYADTALSSYDRVAHWQAFDAAHLEQFTYRGPLDIKTRPWCAARVGKTFSKKEIGKMRNGTRLQPVSKFGGGWNCRHFFIPAPQVYRGIATSMGPAAEEIVSPKAGSPAESLPAPVERPQRGRPRKQPQPDANFPVIAGVQSHLKSLAGQMLEQIQLRKAQEPAPEPRRASSASKALETHRGLRRRVERQAMSYAKLQLAGDQLSAGKAADRLAAMQQQLVQSRADLAGQLGTLTAPLTRDLERAIAEGNTALIEKLRNRLEQIRRQFAPFL
jgi:hypothetical protein